MRFYTFATLFLLSLMFSTTTSAQLKETLHQTFAIDEANKITIDLPSEVEIVQWAGNTLMTETYIELSDARPSILRYYVGEGRYEILGTATGENYSLVAKDKIRKIIRYKDLECYEFVRVKLFVPDDFEVVNETTLVRMDEEASAAVGNR